MTKNLFLKQSLYRNIVCFINNVICVIALYLYYKRVLSIAIEYGYQGDNFLQYVRIGLSNGAHNGFVVFCLITWSNICAYFSIYYLIKSYFFIGIRKTILTRWQYLICIVVELIICYLSSSEKGGTAEFLNEEIILHEYTNKPAILNGWIFSFFGLYELSLILKDKRYKELVEISICSLKNHLNEFDLGYWSKYDMGKMISSPFYHKLHIAQLKALVMIFGDLAFSEILVKFEKYQRSWWNRKRAFIKKAWQKIKE